MQQALRGSCAVCPLRCAARHAASRRSQRGPRAAAHPAAESYSALQQALAHVGELLHAPRINKALLQKQLEVVAADAALVSAQQDAALVAAQKDAENACLRAEIAVLEMQALVVDYLRIKGMLDARGLVEYAEQRLFAPRSPKSNPDRVSKWQQLGQRHPKLEACILAANPAWKAHFIPAKAVQVYNQLSARVHSVDMAANAVLLVEGPLSLEDMRFLKCVADAVHCPCDLRYSKPPSAITQGQPSAAAVGTEGQ